MNYPILHKFLGEEKFCELGIKYAKTNPSKSRSIRWFGDGFAQFLQAQKQKHHLIELAQFEWAMSEVFDAAEAPVVSVAEMTSIPPEKWGEMKFILHPSVRRLDFTWNVISVWQAISDQQTIPLLQRSQNPISWVCWRSDLINHFCSLSKEEGWAFDAVIKGAVFGEICEGLCHWIAQKDVAIKASGFLKAWVQAGLISSIVFVL